MKSHQNKSQKSNQINDKIVVVSIGVHTRLGDVLERALANVSFETVTTEDFLLGNRAYRRVLFAISTESANENAQLHLLTAHLDRSEDFMKGCVCVAIVDSAQGRLAHLDAITLLLAANHAGAMLPARPLVEGDRELRYFSDGRGSPFDRYCTQAGSLIDRLNAAGMALAERPRVRLLNALEGGEAHDWRNAIEHMINKKGGELADIGEPDETMLLCENNKGLPDEKTLSLLDGSGAIRLLIASPATGQELFVASLFARACLRGNYSLLPYAIVLFEGISAVEVIAGHIPIDQLLAEKD